MMRLRICLWFVLLLPLLGQAQSSKGVSDDRFRMVALSNGFSFWEGTVHLYVAEEHSNTCYAFVDADGVIRKAMLLYGVRLQSKKPSMKMLIASNPAGVIMREENGVNAFFTFRNESNGIAYRAMLEFRDEVEAKVGMTIHGIAWYQSQAGIPETDLKAFEASGQLLLSSR